jgi:hypothetical protein
VKSLGADQSRTAPSRGAETEEQRARAREALKIWCKFQIDPKDFQGKDLS